MDRYTMVVLIVLIVMIAGVMRARYSARHRLDDEESSGRSPAEVRRMEEDMRALKDRVAVLERIATDRNHLLEQEFDRLRDK